MDYGHFDDLTRSVVRGGTRRGVLRLLASGALGGLVARLGRRETAEAKKKRRGDGKPADGLQAEGKRNKRRRKKDSRPKDPPPPPCGAGQWRCADNSCVAQDQCCQDERRCPEGCKSAGQCCNDEKRCSDNSCADPQIKCCPGEKRCGDNQCIPEDLCCPGEKPCDGACVPAEFCCVDDPVPLCNGCQQVVCENGEYVCQTYREGVDCGSGYCCPTEPPYFCSEVAGHEGRYCCRPGYGGGAYICY